MLQPSSRGPFRGFPWPIYLGFMVLALGGVLYISHQVNTKGLSPGFLAFMGIDPAAQTSPSTGGASEAKISYSRAAKVLVPNRLVWCADGQVTGLERPGHYTFNKRDGEWFHKAEGGSPGSGEAKAAVEPWLSEHCTLKVDSDSDRAKGGVKTEEFKEALNVRIGGQKTDSFKRTPDGWYLWGQRRFRSPQLDKALKDLDNLASQSAKSGRHL